MPYCINCGNQVEENVKFCPNCGAKLNFNVNNDNEVPPPPKRSMQKGVIKSLQKEIPKVIKSELKEHFFSDNLTKFDNSISSFDADFDESNDYNQEIDSQKDIDKKNSLKKKLIGMYIVLNIFFALISDNYELTAGYMFYTIIIMIAIVIRYKKEKTFNIFLKVLLILQILTGISIIMLSFDSYYYNSGIVIFTLIGLLIVKVMMLVKGNKA